MKKLGDVLIYNVKSHPVFKFQKLSHNGRRVNKEYVEQFWTFDIETTTYSKDINFMYHWQFYTGEYVITGRTWEELEFLFADLYEALGDLCLVVYVHNLSYEFQYMRGVYKFNPDEVFCLKSRSILKACMAQHIEFRCSYKLSNKSLSLWTREFKVPHGKLSGDDFDYDKIRYPWTELTDKELEYCVNDVVGLHECIVKQLDLYDDTLYSVPLTSTGYVRRDCKEALKHRKNLLADLRPDIHVLRLLRGAFRGGNTHASRFYSTRIIHNVHSMDRASSYPDVIVNRQYPMTRFVQETPSLGALQRLLKEHKPFLIKLVLEDVELKNDWWPVPYIAHAKCEDVKNASKDNGRVLQAKSLTIVLTDIDYKIINEEYNFKIARIDSLYSSTYGALPKELIDVVIKYFVHKTSLKGVEGKEELYIKSKNSINSIYGMSVQNPLKEEIIYKDFDYIEDSETTIEDLVSKYKERGFLPYQWGVWITAWARLALEEGIKIAGERFVYCDTDSVKTIGPVDFSTFNVSAERDSLASGAHAENNSGKLCYMGVYEEDGVYDTFLTLGSKKYSYVESGRLHITIAGVGKIKGALELSEHGGIAALKEGFIFRDAAGQEWRYNDERTHNIKIEGREIVITPNISAVPTTYEVSLSDDYRALLRDILNYKMYVEVLDNV